MKRCHAPHPETGDPCLLPEGIHLSHAATGGVIWADEEATREFARRPQKRAVATNPHRKGGGTPRVRPETLARLNAMAERTAPERHAEQYHPPLVRNSDPATSAEAAERYEPRRETAKARVLDYLRERAGQWVDAVDLTRPEVGGFAGTRRMRELRDGGWPIETRPKPGESNTWQHRLVLD